MKEGLSTQQKEADKDLNILALFTLLPLMGFLAFQEPIINFSRRPFSLDSLNRSRTLSIFCSWLGN